MSCLGDVVAALVDGELDHAARERAQRHLAHCGPCRVEVDGQRRLKARLTGDDDEPAPSQALTARLLALRFEPDSRTAFFPAPGSGPRVLVAPPYEPGTDDRGPGRPPGRSRLRPAGRRRAAARVVRSGSHEAPQPAAGGAPACSARSGPARSGPAPGGPAPGGPVSGVGRRRRRGLRRTAAVGSAVAVLGVALVLSGHPFAGPSTPVGPATPAFVGVLVNSTSGQSTGTSSVGGGRSQR